MTSQTPKDLLSHHELLGFTRRTIAGDQVALRASSAKVTDKARFRPSDDGNTGNGDPKSSSNAS